MRSVNQQETFALVMGDIALFLVSLWLTLLFRYAAAPSWGLMSQHLKPFALLFVVWMGVFFVAGLYEKHTLTVKSKLPGVIFNAQIVNSVIAVLFFYLIPYFGITPKTTLFIYLVVSSILILVWRLYAARGLRSRRCEAALLIGGGAEMHELLGEVNGNPRYGFTFVSSLDLAGVSAADIEREVSKRIRDGVSSFIVIDLKNEKVTPFLPHLYDLLFSRVKVIDQHKLYEDIFDRVPLSLVGYRWFLENISRTAHLTYDILKRAMDVSIAFMLGAVSLLAYPFVWVAVKLDDGGPMFITQERVGQGNLPIKILKFRTMSIARSGSSEAQHITRVGKFLRASRIDELPQLWNVVRGDISLVGPRPELPHLVEIYEQEIPYYNVRHLIKPGLSGWAQIHPERPPKFGVAPEETKIKLSYDLYYIKNRSFLLDLKIALKTLKTLLSRSGI